MQDITLKWISDNIEFLLVLCAGAYGIYRGAKKAIKDMLRDEFKNLGDKITNLEAKVADLEGKVDTNDAELGQKIDELNMHTCKNFIMRYLSDIERGVIPNEIERERFSEEWDYYTKNGGNSYLKEWYKQLSDKGWL